MLSTEKKHELLSWLDREIHHLMFSKNQLNLLDEFSKSYHKVYDIIGWSDEDIVIPPHTPRLVSGEHIRNGLKGMLLRPQMCVRPGEVKSFIRKTTCERNTIKADKLYVMTDLKMKTVRLADIDDLVVSLVHVFFTAKDDQLFPNNINFFV